MYKNKKINRNIKRILIVFSSLSILLISFGLLFNRSNNKNNNVGLSSQSQNAQLNGDPNRVTKISVNQISMGGYHSSVLTKTNDLYTWGHNSSGQLGNGDGLSTAILQNITSQFKGLTGKIIQFVGSSGSSIALTDSGQVYTWGWNRMGQLGNGNTEQKATPQLIPSTSFKGLGNSKIIQVSINIWHSIALSSTGQVYTWGWNQYGQLGNEKSGENEIETTPQLIPSTSFKDLDNNEKIIQIALGKFHSAALTNFGKVYTWGENGSSQLGDNSNTNRNTPQNIKSNFSGLTGKIIQLSLGKNHSVALTNTGQVWTWGYNGYGQLGIRSTTNKNTPQLIPSTSFENLGTSKIIQVSLGEYHSSALSSTGQVYTWGNNSNGQLGDKSTEFKINPTEITSKFKNLDGKIIQVSLGYQHSSALSSSGQVYTWGRNWHGQLGTGKYETDENTPTLIIDSPPAPLTPPPASINIGAIIGGVIGGLAALGLIGGLTFFFIKKKNDPNFRMPSFKKK